MTGGGRAVRALLPMSYNAKGPGATCVNLMRGMAAAGLDCSLRLDVARKPIGGVRHRVTLPDTLSFAPYRYLQRIVSPVSERRFLRDLGEGDVAYLWPSVSIETHRAVVARRAPILLEGINTRMGYAKTILDRAYAELGAPPAHGISQRRIDEEDEKLATAAGIFCPSPATEAAARAFYGGEDRILSASYGVDLSDAPAAPRYAARPRGRLSVLFVGTICVRKGAHKLLEAWRRIDVDAELWMLGDVEPLIRERYGDVLDREDVRLPGFVDDVASHYARSDIFVLPSLEEGDPLVTYEAAKHGLPLVVSPMGAGRMGARESAHLCMVDPGDADSIAEAIVGLAEDPDRRAAFGARLCEAIRDFSWEKSGAVRAELVRARFPA